MAVARSNALTKVEKRAWRIAAKLRNSEVDSRHFVLAVVQTAEGHWTLRPFGINKHSLQRPMRQMGTRRTSNTPRQPTSSPELSRIFSEAETVVRARDFGPMSVSDVLIAMLDLPDTLGKELLEKQGIDARKIRAELHAMRTGDPENAPRIQGYVTVHYSRPIVRIFERRARIRKLRPTDLYSLISNLTDYAAKCGLDHLTVTSENFATCLPQEIVSRRGFSSGIEFRKVLSKLADDPDQAVICGTTISRMNPDGYHSARARLSRIKDSIQVDLGELQWHHNPPPHEDPASLTGDIAAVCEQEEFSDVTIPRERLKHFLLDRSRLHSQFDADRCYDALVKQLDQPRNPRRMAGPVCWSPYFWVFVEHGQIRVLRPRWPWQRWALNRRFML